MDAVKLQLCTTIVLAAILFLSFGIFNNCNIPVDSFSNADPSKFGDSFVPSDSVAIRSFDGPKESFLVYKLDFFNFIPVALGFIGWLLFVMFAGIGLIALPFDLIMEFFYQPDIVS